MKIAEDILKGILLISLIAAGILFVYQKTLLKDAGVERGEVEKNMEELSKNEIMTENEEFDIREAEYTDLFEERGVFIANPSLADVEKGKVKAGGSVYLEGYMNDTHLLGQYPMFAQVARMDNLSSFKTHTIKTTKDGKFSDAIPLGKRAGVYKVKILVPQTQHSYDDIGMAEIVTFYIENLGESINSEGLKSYQDIDFGAQFIYPGELYFEEKTHNLDNFIKTASFYADCEVFDKCDNFDTNEIPVLNFSIYSNGDDLSLEEWESKNTGNQNEYTVVEIAGHKAIKFDMSPLNMPIDTYYIEASDMVFRFSAIPGIIDIEEILNSLGTGFGEYVNTKYNYKVNYPVDWLSGENASDRSVATFYKKPLGAGDGGWSNISVRVIDSEGLSIEEWWQQWSGRGNVSYSYKGQENVNGIAMEKYQENEGFRSNYAFFKKDNNIFLFQGVNDDLLNDMLNSFEFIE